MTIAKNTVVTLTYELHDSAGQLLEKSDVPISYLHGGYDNIFPAVEYELQGKHVGDTLSIVLEPENAFGEYDEDLVRVEPKDRFPVPDVKVGMQFEGQGTQSGETLIYTVTDVSEDTVASPEGWLSVTVTRARPAPPTSVPPATTRLPARPCASAAP